MNPTDTRTAAAREVPGEGSRAAEGGEKHEAPAAERDSKQRFTERVQAYQRARPDYPEALARLVLHGLEVRETADVADIGCGTGLSSAPFLSAGCRVVGVEPNDAMRAAAAQWWAAAPRFPAPSSARFSVVAGSAEATTLARASADIVCAGQAFHWFDPASFGQEARRVLRPQGGIALFWNSRQHTASAFMTEFNELLLEYCAEYRAKWKGDDVGVKHAPAMRIVFGQPWQPGLLARVDSDSYAPPPSDPAHAPLQGALQKLQARHALAGKVTIVYQTRIFFGRPA